MYACLTDDLVGLLIETIHQIGARAERKVERELLENFRRVSRKQNLANFAHPHGCKISKYLASTPAS